MRTFNDWEKEIIRKLLAIEDQKSLSLQEFLIANFFQEKSGRALIIQNQNEYAVFFLKKEVFDDETKKTDEIRNLFELIAFVSYLIREAYIVTYHDKKENFYFLQDKFDGVKIVGNNIILNTKGDYTSAPDTIQDVHKNVLYKGIEFKDNQYKQIFESTTGSLIITDKLEGLLETTNQGNKTVQKNKEKEQLPMVINNQYVAQHKSTRRLHISILILVVTCCILLLLAGFFAYLKIREFEQHFNRLNNNHKALRDSLNTISITLKGINDQKTKKTTSNNNQEGIFYGIDISKWNGNEIVEIPQVDSLAFIICKATQGTGYVDPEYHKNWNLINSGEFISGVYHFYVINDDPVKQAAHFWNTIHDQGATDITPIVDIEQASIPKGAKANPSAIQRDFLTFLNELENKCGRTPMIYTDPSFGDEFLQNEQFKKYPLWIADYTSSNKPRVPLAWEKTGFTIWQKRDNYTIKTHSTDFDVFTGKKSQLLN